MSFLTSNVSFRFANSWSSIGAHGAPLIAKAMRVLGLTGPELARRANVSPATISHALNGRRIQPGKFRKIATELHRAKPMPGIEMLIRRDVNPSDPGGDLPS